MIHSGGEVEFTGLGKNAFSMPGRCQGVSETGHIQLLLRQLRSSTWKDQRSLFCKDNGGERK